ncbi:MAG: hypothetical protein COX43_00665 [Parcubacteria group bacterium CG23_combo_of_CG06-09_8_20_14_all_35_9]|nr:MAG: hypothetical protein COX43_00665 [Parcubacteria group bacterium CG23_combo_of_CG06-09_8_20_14_all_35_9]
MQNNQRYFKISRQNPEKFLDKFYIFDNKHPDLEKYIANTKEIKNILITLKTLQEKNEKPKIIEKYYFELQNILNDFSNCSEFICFVNACDNILDSVRNDIGLLKEITKKYFDKRILNEVVPEEWIQAILDSKAPTRKGKCGEIKLLYILAKCGFQEVKTWEDFFNKRKRVAKFSKIFSVKNVRKNLGIKLATKKQNKKLDLIIKISNKIFLVEAKHLNTSGGGQDKQISELIEILSLKEKNKNIFYIVFLDGNYSNILLGNEKCGDKLKTQRKEIQKYLKSNPRNYWLNTNGFISLFSDLKNKK